MARPIRHFLEGTKRELQMIDSPSAIQDHAIIGDLHTVALVDVRGTIDFLCLPRIDGPTVFAFLLDRHAGSFTIAVKDQDCEYRQLYVPDTNVLITRVIGGAVAIEIMDFMVVGRDVKTPIIVRRISALRGRPGISIRCSPAFGYATVKHTASATPEGIVFVPADGSPSLSLISNTDLVVEAGMALSDFCISEGDSRDFVFGASCSSFPRLPAELAEYTRTHLALTIAFWKGWATRSTYRGRYREMVTRSSLTLKLLVSTDYGSIAAAATFGLPEASKGERNWDYRYSWIRDSSFAVYAFIRLGYIEEAIALMRWIRTCLEKGQREIGPLQPIYRLDGSPDMEERELTHFCGYRGAKPVRIGNAASTQLQLDIYGAFMDALYLTSKYGGQFPLDLWRSICDVIDWVCNNWRNPDEGIWEVRNGRQVLLHSRLMCWVAIDRAIRLATKRSLPCPLQRWDRARSAIHHSVVTDCWSDDLSSFVRGVKDHQVDASALMMPLLRFISARDPKWRSTQDRIEQQLVEDGLVFRYNPAQSPDGMRGHEGAFTACSFWFVECLARQGEVERAQLVFEKMLQYGNHVGLFSEEMSSKGEQLGNFPQALTHLALISAAISLDRALSGRPPKPWS
jgi:GH15 family glucan-1,4-alpha-glucosidase